MKARNEHSSGESRPRLAFITSVPITHYYFGTEQYQYLQQAGFEIHLISSEDDTYMPRLRESGFHCHAVPIRRSISPLTDIQAFFKLRALLKRLAPDAVVYSTPKGSLLGALASRFSGVKHRVFLVRGLLANTKRGLLVRMMVYCERLTARLSNGILCVSSSLLEYGRQCGVIPPDKGSIPGYGMSNGIDTSRFDPDKDALQENGDTIRRRFGVPYRKDGGVLLLFVGRLASEKGIRELVQTWKALGDAYNDLHLLVVGEWDATWKLEPTLRKDMETDHRIHLSGHVDNVEDYYAAADILVFPSYREGFPHAPMEAAAMRLPVAAFDAVGTRDAVVDGVTGRLTPMHDAVELAEACKMFIDDPEMRRRFGEAGRERVVRHFSSRNVLTAWIEAFESILSKNASPQTEAET